MKRLGLFTGSGVLGAALVPLLVAVAAILTGGDIFSAGPLNADPGPTPIGGAWSHADLACNDCHTPFWSATRMGDRCLDCHTDIEEELATPASLHTDVASPETCRQCHPEHKGPHASLTLYAPDLYPHAEFGFYLIGHLSQADGRPFACIDCHVDTTQAFSMGTCIECHQDLDSTWMETHELDFGFDCLACHDGIDTYGERFEHQATSFPLEGLHLYLACSTCHGGADNLADLRSTPTDCVACHAPDDVHQGSLGTDCAECHTPSGWGTATVDHNLTAFPLVGGHLDVACETCHVGGQLTGVPTACVDCHRSDDIHGGRLSGDCATCHTAEDWRILLDASFDHGLTGFLLTGAHARVATCADCHAGGRFAGTPTDCVACHRADDAHVGQFGTRCASCHTTNAWLPATFDHTGQTDCASCHSNVKPANHFAGQCSQCHSTTAWLPANFSHTSQTDCTSCHSNVKPANHFAGQCSQCHSTTAWKPAIFSHSQTAFPLTGAHVGAACTNCHVGGVYAGTPKTCVACHGSQDAHSGQFGSNCGACHSTSGWGGASFNHSQTAFPLTGEHVGAACTACHVNETYQGTPTDCAACHADPAFHAGSFGTNCAGCHTTLGWRPAQYGLPHTFPIRHHGAGNSCTNCHTSVVTEYTCFNCHDDNEMAESHENTEISDCTRCHPDGRK